MVQFETVRTIIEVGIVSFLLMSFAVSLQTLWPDSTLFVSPGPFSFGKIGSYALALFLGIHTLYYLFKNRENMSKRDIVFTVVKTLTMIMAASIIFIDYTYTQTAHSSTNDAVYAITCVLVLVPILGICTALSESFLDSLRF